jgi:hypothetical protein
VDGEPGIDLEDVARHAGEGGEQHQDRGEGARHRALRQGAAQQRQHGQDPDRDHAEHNPGRSPYRSLVGQGADRDVEQRHRRDDAGQPQLGCVAVMRDDETDQAAEHE